MVQDDLQDWKDKVNYILYEEFNFGIEGLLLSNRIIDTLGGLADEVLWAFGVTSSTTV